MFPSKTRLAWRGWGWGCRRRQGSRARLARRRRRPTDRGRREKQTGSVSLFLRLRWRSRFPLGRKFRRRFRDLRRVVVFFAQKYDGRDGPVAFAVDPNDGEGPAPRRSGVHERGLNEFL